MNKTIKDLKEGVIHWRIWILLGISDIRQRYLRSILGQFWITLSMGIFIITVGILNSFLFKQELKSFLPYVAANVIVWNLVSGIINDGTYAFINSANYIKQVPLPMTVFVFRSLIRNLLNFFHNLVILIILCMVYPTNLRINIFMSLVGLMLIIVMGFFVTLFLGILSTRFRDVPQIVGNIVQLAFFVTPIMWPADALRSELFNIIEFNPIANLINILSLPLRGELPSPYDYNIVLLIIVFFSFLSLLLFNKYRSRIPYWL